ncbi:hypothetical protein Lal_00016810 [Lupinus albus]|nr:hypothetical protein Lal_00016810 [Lupinus albus]
MGRMHSSGKGMSASALPYKRTPPSWLKISSQDVEENICKFAKKGLTPSQIGVILRDSHGIAQVRSVTGNKILRILKAHGLAPEIPEDLYHLIKKAVSIRKHLERNRKDKDSKFRLILVESRIHRLARYYKKTKKLPPVWKYQISPCMIQVRMLVSMDDEKYSAGLSVVYLIVHIIPGIPRVYNCQHSGCLENVSTSVLRPLFLAAGLAIFHMNFRQCLFCLSDVC